METIKNTEILDDLEDATAYVREHLGGHLERGANFALEPVGYYLYAPTMEAEWSEFIDKGCRGGWTENHTNTLEDTPYPISAIRRTAWKQGTVEIKSPNGQISSVKITPANLSDMGFWQTPQEHVELNNFAAVIKETILTSDSVVDIPDVASLVGEHITLTVRPTAPFEDPFSIQQVDGQTIPVSSLPISSMRAVKTEQGTLVQLGLLRYGDPHASPWMPLDKLTFSESFTRPEEASHARVVKAIGKLIVLSHNLQPTDTALTRAFEQARQTIHTEPTYNYLPAGRRLREKRHVPVARIQGNLTLSTPELIVTPHEYNIAYLPVRGLVRQNRTFWATDPNRGLATPLFSPDIVKIGNDQLYKHLAEYLQS